MNKKITKFTIEMGKRQQKKYNASFKAQIALAAIQNQMTVSEIIEKFGVSKTIIYKWKEEFLSKSATVFEKNEETKTDQRTIDNLHRKIGELEMALDFAKRASKALGIEMPAES